jgi:hypothetical protein
MHWRNSNDYKRTVLALVLAFASSPAVVMAQDGLSSSVVSDAEIRKILAQRIDDYKQSVGIVVGVIDPKGRRVVAYGSVVSSCFLVTRPYLRKSCTKRQDGRRR